MSVEDNHLVLQYGLGVYLAGNTLLDIWKRKISLWSTLLFFVLGMIYQLNQDAGVLSIGVSVLPGVFLLACSILTEQKIGMGDGLVILICGIYLGLSQVIVLMMISLIMTAAAGILAILCKRATAKTELPWTLFVLISYVGMCFLS